MYSYLIFGLLNGQQRQRASLVQKAVVSATINYSKMLCNLIEFNDQHQRIQKKTILMTIILIHDRIFRSFYKRLRFFGRF